MNKPIQQIAEREFGDNDLMVGIKKGKLMLAGTFIKKDIKEHQERLKRLFGR